MSIESHEEKSTENDTKNDELMIQVEQPYDMKDMHKDCFQIIGKDKEGEFRVIRSIKECYLLQQTLFNRWPGIIIPSLPPITYFNDISITTLFSKEEKKIVNENKYFIQLFFNKLAKHSFAVHSHEIRLFFRKQGDFFASSAILPKEKNIDILRKYEVEFKLKSSDIENIKTQDIENVLKYCNKLDTLIAKVDTIVHLTKTFKSQISDTMQNYFKIIKEVGNFEKEQLIESVDWDPKKLYIAKDLYQDNIIRMSDNVFKWAAPITFLDLWSKEEKYELLSIKAAHNSIKDIENRITECTNKLNKLKEAHGKLIKGEISFQSIISTVLQKPKSRSVEESSVEISELDQETNALKKIHRYSLHLLTSVFFPLIKKRQVDKYKLFMKSFASLQGDLFKGVALLWEKLIQNEFPN